MELRAGTVVCVEVASVFESTAMRRLLPMVLLSVLLLPLLAPLLAAGEDAESRLPACCRRGGRHHCAMAGMAEQSGANAAAAPMWRAPVERCPYSPATVAQGHVQDTLAAGPERTFAVPVGTHPAGVAQTESKRRVALDRARQKRGPPVGDLA